MTENEKRMQEEQLTDKTLEQVDGGVGEEDPGRLLYPWQEGDTIVILAERHHTTVQAIQALNPELSDGYPMEPGKLIKLPI